MRVRRRRKWKLAAVTGLVCLAVLHAPILRAAAWALVVAEPVRPADYVLVGNADRGCERAVAMLRDGSARRILLVQDEPLRIMRLGILPTHAGKKRINLNRYGVPDDMIETIDAPVQADWRDEVVLARWLEGQPQVTVVALCDSLWSRRLRYILDRLLDEPARGNVVVHALPNRELDLDAWWKTRLGWKDLFSAWFNYGYARCFGPDEPGEIADPVEYQASLEARWSLR